MTHTGTIKWWSTARGYGFIVPDEDGAEEAFVHFTGIADADYSGRRNLEEGQRVEYALVQKPNGLQAVDVRVLAPAAQ